MSEVSVSVIVPFYDNSEFLKSCLKSIQRQTLKNLEVILVSDGADSDQLRAIRSFLSDDRFVLLEESHKGVSAARNLGIESAHGKYVAFMDSDDFYPNKRTLQRLFEAAERANARICGGSLAECRDGLLVQSFGEDSFGFLFREEGWRDYSDYQFDLGFYRFIYDRNLLIDNAIVFPPYIRYQDPLFFIKAMHEAKAFYAIPDVTYCYRVGHQSRLYEWSEDKWSDYCEAILREMDLAEEFGYDGLLEVAWKRGLFAAAMLSMTPFSSRYSESLNAALVEKKDGFTEKDLLMEERSVLGRELKKAQDEIDSIRSSWTYRLGRLLTFLPRLLKEKTHRD